MDPTSPAARRVYIQSFGCQMNDYDVERMREVLGRSRLVVREAVEDADLIVLNTCSVREKAEAKVASAAGRFRELKAVKPHLKLAIRRFACTAGGRAAVAPHPPCATSPSGRIKSCSCTI